MTVSTKVYSLRSIRKLDAWVSVISYLNNVCIVQFNIGDSPISSKCEVAILGKSSIFEVRYEDL